jgi:hypothetical protein
MSSFQRFAFVLRAKIAVRREEPEQGELTSTLAHLWFPGFVVHPVVRVSA